MQMQNASPRSTVHVLRFLQQVMQKRRHTIFGGERRYKNTLPLSLNVKCTICWSSQLLPLIHAYFCWTQSNTGSRNPSIDLVSSTAGIGCFSFSSQRQKQMDGGQERDGRTAHLARGGRGSFSISTITIHERDRLTGCGWGRMLRSYDQYTCINALPY